MGAGPAQSARDYPQQASVKDQAGDAPAGIDLLSGRFANVRRTATWEVTIRGLSETTFVAFQAVPLSDTFHRVSVFRENGATVGRLYFVNGSSEPTTADLLPCSGLEVSWRADAGTVSASVPSACLTASGDALGRELPLAFEVYTRFGGDRSSARDAMRVAKLGDIFRTAETRRTP